MTHAPRRRAPISRGVQAAQPAWEALLSVLYPPRCLGCGARLPDETEPLCHRCLHRLERAETAHLDALLAHLPEAQAALDGVCALWLFDAGGVVQRVQHALKYGNRPRVGLALGRVMGAIMKAHKGEVDGNLARKIAQDILSG